MATTLLVYCNQYMSIEPEPWRDQEVRLRLAESQAITITITDALNLKWLLRHHISGGTTRINQQMGYRLFCFLAALALL